jgi:hypothetical protein
MTIVDWIAGVVMLVLVAVGFVLLAARTSRRW